jgi:hypothetical protein
VAADDLLAQVSVRCIEQVDTACAVHRGNLAAVGRVGQRNHARIGFDLAAVFNASRDGDLPRGFARAKIEGR